MGQLARALGGVPWRNQALLAADDLLVGSLSIAGLRAHDRVAADDAAISVRFAGVFVYWYVSIGGWTIRQAAVGDIFRLAIDRDRAIDRY